MKTIIFDFGGVFNLDDDVRGFWYNNAEYFGVDPEAANKITLDIWTDARIGKGDASLYFSEAAKFVNKNTEEFKKYFLEYTGWRDDLYQFINQYLKGKYKLGLISNQIESWLEPIIEEKKLQDIFEVIITSYGVGIAKPDIRIYQKAIKDLGVDSKDCVYIDDREKNLEPAKNLGMKTILFKDTESFKNDLFKLL